MERDVPPGDSCRGSKEGGAWHLTVCDPRQAVWKRAAPGALWAVPGGFAAADWYYACFGVRDLQRF